MPDDRLDGPRAEAFLAGALSVARGAARSSTWFELGMRSVEAALAERPSLPTPTWVLDLTVLLHGEPLQPMGTPPTHPALRDALRSYEDHVLARLLGDRRWVRVCEAIAALPKSLRPVAVGLVCDQLLTRLEVNEGTGLSAGVVRRCAQRVPEEVFQEGRLALEDPEVSERLARGLDSIARASRRARELLTDAEVFLVENLAALKGLGSRVALSQLALVAQLVDESLPARRKATVMDDGDAPTALEAEAALPMGGFSSVSTQGSLENLVTSELIYMEPPDSQVARPDLFDVRFVESELLYYARDESVAVRRRRSLVLVFDASLQAARVKDPGERYQRLVWLLGAVAALVRKLSSWLDTEALSFELVFTGASDGAGSLVEEQGVLSLLLREYQERGQVSVSHAPTALEAIRSARGAPARQRSVVLFAATFPSGLEGDAAPDALVEMSGALPKIHWRTPQSGSPGASSLSAAWAFATSQLLDGVLRPSRRSPSAL